MELELDLGQPQQPLLRKSPLRVVLCQLRFPKILGLGRSDVRPFAAQLVETYPLADVDQMQPLELQISPAGVQQVQGIAQSVFKFQSEDGTWTVTLTDEWVALETTAYSGFPDFISRWFSVATATQKAFDLDRELRVGLRYVNELKLPEGATIAHLRSLLSSEVIGPVSLDDRAEQLLRSWQEVRFRHGDNQGCTMQHGYMQNAQEDWVYVLDYDAYREGNRPLDLEEQVKTLASLNHHVFSLFSVSVTPETFAAFEPEERDE